MQDRAFALFFHPHPGGFDSSRVLTPQICHPRQKNANARGSTWEGRGGGGRGLGAAGIDTDALFLNNRLIQPLGCDVILNKLSFYIYPKKKEKHEAIRKSEKGYS